MKKPQKNSLINKTLEYLKETSKDILNLSVDIILCPEEIISEFFPVRGHRKYYISKDISRLKNSSYFTAKTDKIYLTAKGRIEIIKNIIKDRRSEKWSGKWWAIIFDIPELNRKERGFLRQELKWIGFKEIQKSVWIFPFNIEKELFTLLKLWKKDFKGDIRFLKIDKITEDVDIKKSFNL